MSTPVYQEFFLHFFVDPQRHCFTSLQQRFKQYQSPGLDHPKKASDLGYLKNYKTISSKYLIYVPSQKTEIKFTLKSIREIICEVYSEYEIFFQKGGAYRIISNFKSSKDSKPQQLSAHIQELTLLKLCQKFPELKTHFKSLDRLVMGFFFTLNYIKTCNIDAKGFCMLLQADNDEQSPSIQNLFFNFLVSRLSDQANNSSDSLEEVEDFQTDWIRVSKFQKILKILSKDDQLTNVSILTQQHNYSSSIHNLADFSSIKSLQLKQQNETMLGEEKMRSVIALEILINFIKTNCILLTQIKIYKLLKLAGLAKEGSTFESEQQKSNSFSKLKGWEEILSFCFEQTSIKNGDLEIRPQQKYLKDDRLPYEKVLLMQICKLNFTISERLFNELSGCSSQSLESYREETYEFILNYLDEIMAGKTDGTRKVSELFQKLKSVYNFGDVVLKPLVTKVLKHPEMHKIYLKYFTLKLN